MLGGSWLSLGEVTKLEEYALAEFRKSLASNEPSSLPSGNAWI